MSILWAFGTSYDCTAKISKGRNAGNPFESFWFQEEVEYLGYVIYREGFPLDKICLQQKFERVDRHASDC